MHSDIDGKRIAFITTKNLDYIRNTQEIGLLKHAAASVEVIGSKDQSYVKRLFKVYRRLLFGAFRDYDVVFVGFAPQLVLPLFHWKFRHCRIIEDFFISMYDTLVFDRKRFGKGSLAAKLLKRIDISTLKKGDIVISDTKTHGRYFVDELKCDPDRLHVLYLEADDSIYNEALCNEVDVDTGIFKVLYFGSILPLQGVDVVMKAIERLQHEDRLRFEVIGPLSEDLKIESDRIEYHSWLSQEELARHIAGADLCLAGHFSGDIMKARRTIPGKAYIYRAMGKPMILGDNPANHELYVEDGRTWFVKMGDPEALARGISAASRQLMDSRTLQSKS